MSNFRPERAFVMLDQPIAGFDHIKAIDPVALSSVCLLTNTDADLLGLDPLSSFGVPAGDKPWQPRQAMRWRAASLGLKTVRGLIAHYTAQIAKGQSSAQGTLVSYLPAKVEVLRQLEAVLDRADTHDRRFCLALKDLP